MFKCTDTGTRIRSKSRNERRRRNFSQKDVYHNIDRVLLRVGLSTCYHAHEYEYINSVIYNIFIFECRYFDNRAHAEGGAKI